MPGESYGRREGLDRVGGGNDRQQMKMNLMICAVAFCVFGPAAVAAGEKATPGQEALTTRWAREVTPEKVHAEYPRPQLVRPDWVNLNGHWDFALTSQHTPEPWTWESKILVPFPVEAALSGVKKNVSDAQRLWYHRTFTVPAAWQGKRVLLHFGAADWETTVSVNGKQLGTHRGGYDAFNFDITEALKPSGTNDLVVTVWDPADAGSQPRGKQVRSPHGIWYTGTSGLWQTVWLEPVAPAHIESVKITPDFDASAVTLEVSVVGTGGKSTVKAEVLEGPKVVQTGEVSVEGSAGTLKPRLALKIPNAKPWSPDSPFLYGLRVGLHTGDRAMGERRETSPSPLNGERESTQTRRLSDRPTRSNLTSGCARFPWPRTPTVCSGFA